MKTCSSCGHEHNNDASFCVKCGTSLSTNSNEEMIDRKKKKPINKGSIILITLAAAIIFTVFTAYHLIAKNYSEEAVTEEFTSALLEKNKERLREMISPSDSRLKINNQSLDSLFALIDKEPSLIQEIENSLKDEGLGNHLFFIRKDGRHYGTFQRYNVDTPGYFINIKHPDAETTVFLNNSEIGVIENTKNAKEFGPFLAGVYDLKLLYTIEEQQIEENFPILLTGTKTTTEITVNNEPDEEPKENTNEERKETVIIKEVIREVPSTIPNPSYNYYLLPHSSHAYLTYSDIAGFSQNELRIARNEIFARHGYIFQSKDLQHYFNNQQWYTPNANYNGHLSTIEQYNVNFIRSYE
ncbi:YARHG domain-containing protein [Anaerobacillus sp. MEB173]|uniref:YARHG domain-containing protein n=1 Tax=Anaerobacillus sp. MEB173 TaxID=3383345 RepID=UPI003F92F2F1